MEKRRQAAAVLLTRDLGSELEVYLIERSRKLRFFGGYWALPGGVLDPVLDAPLQASQLAGGTGDLEARHSRCAQRELFEETGVLLGPRANRVSKEERRDMRQALTSQEAAEVFPDWSDLLQRAGFEASQLAPFAQLLTPPFAPLRYETSFHHVSLAPGEQPEVDGQECVRGDFFKAAEVLERWTRGEIFVVPPTLYLLRHLSGAEGQAELRNALSVVGESCRKIAAGRLYGACQSPGILAAPLRTPTIPPATTTNTYLVGNERVYVVDPATPFEDERQRLFAFCDEVPAQGRRIAGILLTHHHEDHVGSAQALALRYDVTVGAHPQTHARVDLGSAKRRDIGEGELLALGTAPDGSLNWILRALHTPGHAPGHLAFIESYLKGAIVGDLVSTLSTIVIDPPEGHMATYLASLQRLIDADIRVLHPAHGLPMRNGVELVQALLHHRENREAKLLAALSQEPATTQTLLDEVYDDVTGELKQLASRSLLAGLEKLSEEGLAQCGAGGWSRC